MKKTSSKIIIKESVYKYMRRQDMKIKFTDGKFYMDESLIIEKQQLLCPIERHTHEFIEIVYILKGRCIQKIDDVEYPANGGDLFFINYNHSH